MRPVSLVVGLLPLFVGIVGLVGSIQLTQYENTLHGPAIVQEAELVSVLLIVVGVILVGNGFRPRPSHPISEWGPISSEPSFHVQGGVERWAEGEAHDRASPTQERADRFARDLYESTHPSAAEKVSDRIAKDFADRWRAQDERIERDRQEAMKKERRRLWGEDDY